MQSTLKRFGAFASIVTVIVCVILITGSTFSLFTGGDNGDVIIDAANVEVSVSIGNLKLYSKGVEQLGTKFQNGGIADASDLANGKLVLTNMSPMDRITFTVDVTNESTIDTVYRVKISANGELAEALVVQTAGAPSNFGVTDWIPLAAASSENGDKFSAIVVSVEFPNGDADKWIPEETGDNVYENTSCTIDIAVEAVQGNADVVNPVTYDAATNTYTINSEEGEAMMDALIASGANVEITDGVVIKGGEYYLSNANGLAWLSGQSNLSIKLANDIDFDAAVVLQNGVTLDGNGCELTYSVDDDYHLVRLGTGSSLKNITLNNYRARTENATSGVVTLSNVTINMDNDETGLDISRGSGTANLTNVVCASTTDVAHLDPNTQVQVDYTPYGDVLLGSAWALEATDCAFGSLHGWNTRNSSNVYLNNTTYTVFRMHYWSGRTLYINGVETAWSESGAIPVAHDVGGCWSVQPAFK